MFSTLRSAYSGYFDDVSVPSSTAKPLGAVPTASPVTASVASPEVVRAPSAVYYHQGGCEEDGAVVYVQLTQLQFALLCMCAGVAVGLLISRGRAR